MCCIDSAQLLSSVWLPLVLLVSHGNCEAAVWRSCRCRMTFAWQYNHLIERSNRVSRWNSVRSSWVCLAASRLQGTKFERSFRFGQKSKRCLKLLITKWYGCWKIAESGGCQRKRLTSLGPYRSWLWRKRYYLHVYDRQPLLFRHLSTDRR